MKTNILIVYPGKKLFLKIRRALVEGTDTSHPLLEKACNTLLFRGIAAIPDPDNSDSLLVATTAKVPTISLRETDWALDVCRQQ